MHHRCTAASSRRRASICSRTTATSASGTNAAITALETSTYWIDFGKAFLPVLLTLMCIKFVMVVSLFMHLKFDNKIFSWIFYSGLILAVLVYMAFLATFRFFAPT